MPVVFQIDLPKLYVWEMKESPEALATMLDNANYYKMDLLDIKSLTRRKEKLTTYVLLNKMLGHDAFLVHRESGAPYLPYEPYSVSISHTKGYAAVVLSPAGKCVAVDIEYPSERVCSIRHRFLSSEENMFINLDNEAAHLLVCWCAKETLYKMIDMPGVDFVRHLHICPFLFSEEGEIEVYETRTTKRQSFKLKYQVNSRFTIVWSVPL